MKYFTEEEWCEVLCPFDIDHTCQGPDCMAWEWDTKDKIRGYCLRLHPELNVWIKDSDKHRGYDIGIPL